MSNESTDYILSRKERRLLKKIRRAGNYVPTEKDDLKLLLRNKFVQQSWNDTPTTYRITQKTEQYFRFRKREAMIYLRGCLTTLLSGALLQLIIWLLG